MEVEARIKQCQICWRKSRVGLYNNHYEWACDVCSQEEVKTRNPHMCQNCIGTNHQSSRPWILSTRAGYEDWCAKCADSLEEWCVRGPTLVQRIVSQTSLTWERALALLRLNDFDVKRALNMYVVLGNIGDYF